MSDQEPVQDKLQEPSREVSFFDEDTPLEITENENFSEIHSGWRNIAGVGPVEITLYRIIEANEELDRTDSVEPVAGLNTDGTIILGNEKDLREAGFFSLSVRVGGISEGNRVAMAQRLIGMFQVKDTPVNDYQTHFGVSDIDEYPPGYTVIEGTPCYQEDPEKKMNFVF